jgi:hypothetical protein
MHHFCNAKVGHFECICVREIQKHVHSQASVLVV